MNVLYLHGLWRKSRNNPGWLSEMSGFLAPEDIEYVGELEDRYFSAIREMRDDWREKLLEIRRPEVDSEWARERRAEYLKGRLADAKNRLVNIRLERGSEVGSGDEFLDFLMKMDEDDCIAEVRRLLSAVSSVQASSEFAKGSLTDDMIIRARQVRIETLLGDKKMVSCPFHGEDRHPSASISKGFFKCFTCGERADAIKWLMKVENYSFPDAVRKLAGG